MDEVSLLLWSDKQDFRARGRSKTRWHERHERAEHVASRLSPVGETPTPLAQLLKGPPAGRFRHLPCPASYKLQVAVCEALDATVEVFKQRVEELEVIGHAHSLELADDDYRDLLGDVGDIRDILASYAR